MAKKVLNLFKKLGNAYMKSVEEVYGPMFNCTYRPLI